MISCGGTWAVGARGTIGPWMIRARGRDARVLGDPPGERARAATDHGGRPGAGPPTWLQRAGRLRTVPRMSHPTRREFLSGVAGALAAAAPLGAVPSPRRPPAVGRPGVAAPRGAGPPWDFLVAGGTLYDAAQGIAARRDVAILDGTVAAVAERLPAERARRVIDATDMIVTPGLIDVHVHVYPGVASLGIDADLAGIAKGVTTLIDAGSAGATTFAGFRRDVVQRARTRVYALVNMSRTGLTLSNELADPGYVDVAAVVATIERNRDVAVGIKVRMLALAEGLDLEVMRRTREASDRAGVPVTVHIGGQTAPLSRIIDFLRPGDVITHALRRRGGILDGNGRVDPAVVEAVGNGIHLDVGHGMGNLDFDVAERVLDQGVLPSVISSDVHDGNAAGPVFDLPTTLSKLMMLGMPLERVVEAATATPARIFDLGYELGTLRVGAPADLAVFELVERPYAFVDSSGNRRTGAQRLAPYLALRDGFPYGVRRG